MGKTRYESGSRWRISSDELPSQFLQQQNYRQQSLPEALGIGHSKIFQLDQDLSYIETHFTPSKDLAVLSRIESEDPRLVVTLALQGQSRFAGQQGDELVFTEGYTSITAFNSSRGERQYEAHKPVKQLRLAMTKRWLESYFGEKNCRPLFNNKGTRLLSHRPISPQAVMAANQLLNGNVAREVRPLFMQGQALSLLAAELSPLYQADCRTAAAFGPKDKVLAHAARDILQREFRNPPSVQALSKRVGTNQFKLKKLFHHFFNTTPYGLLLEIRMNRAYQLLESTHCLVNVAADQVGYSHASNFSTAFTKFFGIPPKAISKQH